MRDLEVANSVKFCSYNLNEIASRAAMHNRGIAMIFYEVLDLALFSGVSHSNPLFGDWSFDISTVIAHDESHARQRSLSPHSDSRK